MTYRKLTADDFILMAANRTITDFRPETVREHRRRIRAMEREAIPSRDGWFETAFWVVTAALAGLITLSCPVLFVMWWLGMY